MESAESLFTLVIVLFLGLSLIVAIIGVFIFNGFNWWDKL